MLARADVLRLGRLLRGGEHLIAACHADDADDGGELVAADPI